MTGTVRPILVAVLVCASGCRAPRPMELAAGEHRLGTFGDQVVVCRTDFVGPFAKPRWTVALYDPETHRSQDLLEVRSGLVGGPGHPRLTDSGSEVSDEARSYVFNLEGMRLTHVQNPVLVQRR